MFTTNVLKNESIEMTKCKNVLIDTGTSLYLTSNIHFPNKNKIKTHLKLFIQISALFLFPLSKHVKRISRWSLNVRCHCY